jgi:hypothetical protein
MAVYGERTRRELDHDGKGLTGTIVYLCDWLDVDPAPIEGLPKVGDPWIDPFGNPNPFLRCVHANAREGSGGECEWTAQFSTQGEIAEAAYETSLEISMEPGPELTGFVWQSTGTPVIGQAAKPIPVGTLSVKMRRDLPPYDVVMETAGKVNDGEFLGIPAGCVLFLGAGADNSYDLEGKVVSSGVVYKFSIKRQEHKYFWRPPLQGLSGPKDDPPYMPLIWHNVEHDPPYPYYTTDQAKIATPVWIHETPGQSANPAGIGGWDTIEDTDEVPYYEEADFASVLDIS